MRYINRAFSAVIQTGLAVGKDAVSRLRLLATKSAESLARLRLTSVVPTTLASDTFTRANQAGFGTASDGETYTVNGPGTLSIASNEGVIVSSNTDTNAQLGTTTATTQEVIARVSFNNASDIVGIQVRYSFSGGNPTSYKLLYYGNAINLNRGLSGSNTTLASTSVTLSTNTFYWFKLRSVGITHFAKYWASGTTEPAAWTLTANDTTISSGGFALLGNTATGSTGTRFDSLTATDAINRGDALTRFHLGGATSALRYASTRLRVFASKVGDTSTRLRVLSTKSVDGLQRLRLFATRSVDSLSRFAQQSATLYRNAQVRVRLLANRTIDAQARFRQQIVSSATKETLSRLRVQSATLLKDGVSRLRVLAMKSVESATRYRLQSANVYNMLATRLRVQSGIVARDGITRFRQLSTRRADQTARFKQQSGPTLRDAVSRLRVQLAPQRILDALSRLRMLSTKSGESLTRLGLTLAGYSATIFHDTPQAYYRLDEASGTTAHDSTANHYDATITGVVTLSAPAVITHDPDPSMAFDGSTGYVALPSGIDPTGWNAFTAECWFLYQAGGYAGGRVLSNGHTDSNGTGFQLAINTTSGGLASIGAGTSASNLYWSSSTFTPGTPYHYVLTYDGTTATAYLNGALVGSGSLSGAIKTSGYPLNIGRGSYNNDYTKARIDEVAIYNYALSSAQVATHYRVGVPLNKDASLRFPVQSGTTYRDAVSRLRLQLLTAKALDTGQRLRLLASQRADSVSRMRLKSALLTRDSTYRLRQQSGVLFNAVSTRLRLLAVAGRDSTTRLRVQSPLTARDTLSRLKVASSVIVRNVGSRFTLGIAVFKTAQLRFKQQSGLLNRDGQARFRMQLASQRAPDQLTRFRLFSTKVMDQATRFKQQSATLYKGAASRLRVQSGVIAHESLQRLRVQSGVMHRVSVARLRLVSSLVAMTVVARLRLISGLLGRDTAARWRLKDTALRNSAYRFAQRSQLLLMGVGSRFRQQSGRLFPNLRMRFALNTGNLPYDATCLFRLIDGAAVVTLQSARGPVTFMAERGISTDEGASGNITLQSARGTIELEVVV